MSLYDELGGEAAINAAVELFYNKILADSRVNYFFDGMDMERQRKMQKSFLTFAFGGPNHYSGQGMRAAHRRQVEHGLNGTHFDIIVEHLGNTLRELGVAGDKIQRAADTALSVRSDVLGL